MNKKELTAHIQEEIQYIPCFFCIDGYLELKDIAFEREINAVVYCESCDTQDSMQFNLKLKA